MADWSEWPRQVTRGVRQFVHEQPGWAVYFSAGEVGIDQVLKRPERFDGIITASLAHAAAWGRIIKSQTTKVVAVTSVIRSRIPAVSCVRVDDNKVAECIGRHLVSGGFRRFAFVYGPKPGWRNYRSDSLAAFARTQNLPCEIIPFKSNVRTGRQLLSLSRTLSKLQRPIGIVTWNLHTARFVVEACQLAKIDIPAEAAVVSWDDDPMLAETLEPSISAAVLPAERVGYEAARMLKRLIDGECIAGSVVLIEPPGVIHVRQSSDVSALDHRDIYLAQQHIREHATETLSVGDIAHAVGLSRSKLEKDFKKVTGMTVHDAIVSVRLEKAKQLLLDTEWTTSRIARQSGMGTEQSLRKAFRHRYPAGSSKRRWSGSEVKEIGPSVQCGVVPAAGSAGSWAAQRPAVYSSRARREPSLICPRNAGLSMAHLGDHRFGKGLHRDRRRRR